MNRFDVIHLATHGEFLPLKPLDSFITFGNGEHATLRDMEEWNVFTNVDMIVLSACQTALSVDTVDPEAIKELSSGIEILGIAYQMQRKGAQTTLASLWKVQDESTQVLMTEFYRQLQQGDLTKAEALRRAQQKLSQSENYAHPFHWAAFILIGNGL